MSPCSCWLPSAGQATVTELEVLASSHCLPTASVHLCTGVYPFPAQGAHSGPHSGPPGPTLQMRRARSKATGLASISFLAGQYSVKHFRMKWCQPFILTQAVFAYPTSVCCLSSADWWAPTDILEQLSFQGKCFHRDWPEKQVAA